MFSHLLYRFPKWSEFQSFQDRRASLGCEQWLTILLQCADGMLVSLTPLRRHFFGRTEDMILNNIISDSALLAESFRSRSKETLFAGYLDSPK